MFFRENATTSENVRIDSSYNADGDRTIYRTQYPFETKTRNENDFFKSLEGILIICIFIQMSNYKSLFN